MRKILCRPNGKQSTALYEFRDTDESPTLVDLEPDEFYEISEEGSGVWTTMKADGKGEIGVMALLRLRGHLR